MSDDPRVLVLAEMRKQTALLDSIDKTATLVAIVLTKLLEAFPKNDAPVNDAVCNGPNGDPIVKARDPRDWTGPPQTGKRFSECPPEYLDMLADRYDYFVDKARQAVADAHDDAELQKAEKDGKYAKLDAQRARAWAARLRTGWTAPVVAKTGEDW